MNPVFEYTLEVNEASENYIRHVNNLRYLEWFIDAAERHSKALGWGMEICKTMGLAWVAVSHHIEYKAPAYQGERLTIKTWIQKLTPARVTRCYECYRGEQLLCEATTVWVLVDYEGERPRPIPKQIREKITSLIS